MIRRLVLLVLLPVALRAHDPGLSSATVDLATREMLVQLVFAPADLASFTDEPHARLAARCVTLRTRDITLEPKNIETREVGPDNVEFTLRFPRPTGEVHLGSMLLPALPFGHRQTFTLRDTNGTIVSTALFSAAQHAAMIPAAPAGQGVSLEALATPRAWRWPSVALAGAIVAAGAAWICRNRLRRQAAD